MKGQYYLFATMLVIIIACGGGDNSVEIPETINDPVAALLIFPEENSECNEGVVLNDLQSKVTFKWNVSEHTDSYEVNLQNLDSKTNSKIESGTNSVEITLNRGSAYKWYVVSKADESTEIAQSESWQFYNAAPGVVNYAPFPAEATNPINGSTIESISGKVTLTWDASDLDNDIIEHEVFYGTTSPPATSSGVLTDAHFELDVAVGTTSYWMVKTRDEANNISESEIFNFIVQ